MILLKSPTSSGGTETNYIFVGLEDHRDYTGNNWRFRLTSRTTDNVKAFKAKRLLTTNDRYYKFEVQFMNNLSAQNLENGQISLWDEHGEVKSFPPGFYDLEVYQEPDGRPEETNLVLTLTAFIYIGTESMDELREAYESLADPNTKRYVYPD